MSWLSQGLRKTGLNKPFKFAGEAISQPVRGVGRVLRGDFDDGFKDILSGGAKAATLAGGAAMIPGLAGGVGGAMGALGGAARAPLGVGRALVGGAGSAIGAAAPAVKSGLSVGGALKGVGDFLGGNQGMNGIMAASALSGLYGAHQQGRAEEEDRDLERDEIAYRRQRAEMYDPQRMALIQSLIAARRGPNG